jgi:phospholipid/cholesterol/gamma-HCH transport system substrate-binding protein
MEKLMNYQKKTLAVGLFVLIAILIATFAVFKFRPSVGDGQQLLSVRFSNLDKIAIGTRVTFAGNPVGQVDAIRILQNARDQKVDRLGRIYFYELDLKLDSAVQVYSSDEITVHTTGLFGEKIITITPKPSQSGTPPVPLRKGEVVYVSSYDPVDETLQQLNYMGTKLTSIFDDLKELTTREGGQLRVAISKFNNSFTLLEEALIQANQAHLIPRISDASTSFSNVMTLLQQQLQKAADEDLLHNISQTAAATASITQAFNNPEQLKQLLSSSQQFFIGVDQLQQQIQQQMPSINQTLENLHSSSASLRNTMAEAEQTLKKIKEGEGTIGKLLQREDLYLDVMGVTNKASILMNDLNHYGLLFHNNSTWKKQRAKRMAEIEKISTPQQLMTFFESELDGISTALSRMQTVIKVNEKLNSTHENSDSDKQEFQKAFRDLINRLEYLESTAKNYSSQNLVKAHN